MPRLINGLHHVTALASDAQAKVDFYTGVLGLRLIKKTVNFDAPEVYHFYFGNAGGSPGTIMTFFPYAGLQRGTRGTGQVSFTAFSVPEGAVSYWLDRLTRLKVQHEGPAQRFGRTVITMYDNDGLGLELIADPNDARQPWDNGDVPVEHAVRGFHSVTLLVADRQPTAALLTDHMDHELIAQEGDRYRYSSGGDVPGYLVDVVHAPDERRALQGAGTVHHVAFSVKDDADQVKVRELLNEAGMHTTPVVDRDYFHSIYFREPGHILFEVATEAPGFTVDETFEGLGTALKLPRQHEHLRTELERTLPPITVNMSS